MRIGLLAPSVCMSPTYFGDMVFAPRDLCLSLADGLVAKGHDVYLYTAPDVKTKAHLIGGNYDLLRTAASIERDTKKKGRAKWSSYFTCIRHFEHDLIMRCYARALKKDIDIIHVYQGNFSHYYNDLTHVPTIYTMHDPVPPPSQTAYSFLFHTFQNHRFVSVSQAQYKNTPFQQMFIDTVYHGISLPPDILKESPYSYLAFMGRCIPQKGAEDAIQVARFIQKPLCMAMSLKEVSNDKDYMKRTVQPFLSDPMIHRMPFLTGKKKYEFSSSAFAFLFPIHWEEPFGMVMIEVMACGTPVVAYARGSVPEVVVDGVTGFIVNESEENKRGDWIVKKTGIEGLVEAIRRLESLSKEDYIRMRQACRKHVEEHFSLEQMVSGYERVYETVLQKQ